MDEREREYPTWREKPTSVETPDTNIAKNDPSGIWPTYNKISIWETPSEWLAINKPAFGRKRRGGRERTLDT